MKTRRMAWSAAALFVVPALGLAGLVLDPTGFPFWRSGEYSDLLISHWPIAAFIRESLAAWNQFPLWNPLILSGMPLTADPLSGFWYAPNVLGWMSSSGLGFNLLFWAHLGFAACGVMWLLRSEGASPAAALLGGAVFAATPKLVGTLSLGHLTLVEAVCWTPWILLAIRNAIERGLEPVGRLWRFGVAGALVGLTFLIDPRWLIPAALLSFAYLGKCIAHSQPRQGRISLWRSATACLIGLGVAAPSLVPLVELLPKTTRWGMAADVAEQISLPPARLIGSLLFDGGASPETQTYLGATVVLLLAVGAAASIQRGRFWTATLVVSLLLALGSFTPLYGLVMRIVPGMGSLRVPARFYLLVALAAGMLAGHGFDRLLEAASDAGGKRRARLAAIGVGALLLMLSLASFLLRARAAGSAVHPQAWPGLVGGVLAAGAAACAFALSGGARGARLARPMLMALVALDLGMANAFTLRVEPAETALKTGMCALAGAPGGFGERRTFSPSYSLPQQLAPLCNLELTDGVNPLQLTAYRDAMASATGFDAGTYSVTLPPFADGDVRSDWHPTIDAAALGLFNVDRIVSAYPLDSPGLELLTKQEGQWVYRNLQARPRAWVERQDASGGAWRPVLALDWTPNRIRVRADGPGRLVLSEIAYPGWRARVDGAPVATVTYASVLRSVALEAGVHEVVLTFVPASLALGASIGTLALIALLALKVLRR